MAHRKLNGLVGGIMPTFIILAITIGAFAPKTITASELEAMVGGAADCTCALLGVACPTFQGAAWNCGQHWSCPSGNVGEACRDSGTTPCSSGGSCADTPPNDIFCEGLNCG